MDISISRTLQQAMQELQVGDLDRAERSLRSALRELGEHSDTVQLLGVVRAMRHSIDEAIGLFTRAIHLDPGNHFAHFNLAKVHADRRDWNGAVTHYRAAAELRPNRREAWLALGTALAARQNLADAIAAFDRGIAVDPGYPETWVQLGAALQGLGRHEEALAALDKALSIKPDCADACFYRGVALNSLGRFTEALANFDRAGTVRPDLPEIWLNRGVVLNQLDRHAEAIASLDQAIQMNPDDPLAWGNRGISLNALGRRDEALGSYRAALDRKSDYHEAWSYRGVTLHELNRLEEALASYDEALRIRPDFCEAWTNRGLTLHDMQRFDQALESYRRALEVDPDDPRSHWNEGVTRLTLGDFDGGWRKYRRRWDTKKLGDYRHGSIPQLPGPDRIDGHRVLLWCEQGFGDTVQFSRYASLLTALGADVTLEVQRPLKSLMKTSFPECAVVERGEAIGPVQFQLPLMDLPGILSTDLSSIPARAPYLRVSEQRCAVWRQRLKPGRGRPNIGIACSGSEAHPKDGVRSAALAAFEPLSTLGNLYVIQKDLRSKDREFLAGHGEMRYVGDDLDDFEDTAAVVANMDLVVCIDTSLAHVAGALAKPVHLLLAWPSDWRWLLDRQDSPWYPTMRLYRLASPGGWSTVMTAVVAELRRGQNARAHPTR